MYKGSDLIGKSVVSYDTGQRQGQIKRLLIDPEKSRLLGFLVNNGGAEYTYFLSLARIKAIGADAVITDQAPASLPSSMSSEESSAAKNEDFLAKRLKILTDDGRDLGTIIDAYVDEKQGEVVGFEVTEGAFASLSGGHGFVPTTNGIKVGKEFLFIPGVITERMNERESLQQPVSQDVGGQAGLGAEKVEKATAPKKEDVRTVAETEGRRAQRTVYTGQQDIIVAQGQIITAAIIEQARTHKLEHALIAATRSSSWGAHKLVDEEVWQHARTRLQEEAEQLSTGVGKLWQRVKEGAGEWGKFGAKRAQDAERQDTSQVHDVHVRTPHDSTPSSAPASKTDQK